MNPSKSYYHAILKLRPALSKQNTVIVGIATLLLLLSCNTNRTKSATSATQAASSYQVLTIQPRAVTLHSDYPASIQGLQNIEIRPKVDGFVEKIYVDEGSVVKKGQLLFKINAPQYEQDVRTAQAGIKTAEADVNTAKLQVEKVKPLVEKEIISHYELRVGSKYPAIKTGCSGTGQSNARKCPCKPGLYYHYQPG